MSTEPRDDGLRGRLGARGEELLGRVAQDLLEHPWVSTALTAALEARGRAAQAQEVAMDLLNLPSAAHLERLTRRVRSLSQRIESIEDLLGRIDDGLRGTPAAVAARLDGTDARLDEVLVRLGDLQERDADSPAVVSPDQERLRVEDLGRGAAVAPPPRPRSAQPPPDGAPQASEPDGAG